MDGNKLVEQLLNSISQFLNIMIRLPSTDDIEIPLWLAFTIFGILIGGVAGFFKWLNNRFK